MPSSSPRRGGRRTISARSSNCTFREVVEVMKIVGFKTNEGLRLGVVEGEEVIDLQAVDENLPSDLGEWLRRNNGDLTPIEALAERAPSNARRPLKGVAYALPVARPGKIICLGVNYLEHFKEAFQSDNVAKFPTIFIDRKSTR